MSLGPHTAVLLEGTEGGGQKQAGLHSLGTGCASRVAHIIQYEDQQQGGRSSLLCDRTHAHEQPAFPVEEAAGQRHGNLCWLKSCLKPGNK